jgi:DNA-binding LytR/AlgR family response regulator
MSYLTTHQEFTPSVVPTSALSASDEFKLYYSKISLQLNELVYLESDVNYTIFHMSNGKKHISGFTLKYHLDKMAGLTNFFRVNRSICINLNFASDTSLSSISLHNGLQFTVSRRRQKDLAEIIN